MVKIISCNSNKELAESIARYCDIPLMRSKISKFADSETQVEIKEGYREEDVFVIQSTSTPANDNLMELLVTVDALRRGSAKRITAVLPYFGYARQDRKMASRSPISAKLVANLLVASGVDRILTMELHTGQIQGFFDIPVDTLISRPVFVQDIKQKINGDTVTFVSPDVGGVTRTRDLAKPFGADIAIIDKRRPAPGESKVMNVVGTVKNKKCILVDDIIDSGGTLCNAAQALIDAGAKSVSAYITHGVLSSNAQKRIESSVLDEVVITDTIKTNKHIDECEKIRVLSVASIIGEAIVRVSAGRSVSSLFYD